MNSFSLHAAHMHEHAGRDGGEENRNGRDNIGNICTL